MSSERMVRWGLGLGAWIVLVAAAACGDTQEAPTSVTQAGASGETGAETSLGGAPADSPLKICGRAPERSACDPVTAAPCDVLAGETCDFLISSQSFQCLPGPNPVEPGGTCDTKSQFCAPTASCNVSILRCQHYCCDDADCTEGACEKAYRVDGDAMIGVCLDEYRSDCEGGAGCGGAGGSQ